jgi:hypothetical protein
MTNRARDQAELDEILLPEGTQLPEAEAPPPRRLRKGRANTAFVMVPIRWVERLAKARTVATVTVAIRLLHLHWREGKQPVVLGNVALRDLGVDRHQKRRALTALECMGLISVERRPKQSPRITLHLR